MSEDIGYINARLRGMKSFLLTPDKYEEILNKNTLSEFVDSLKDTPYRDFLPPSYPEPSLKEVLDGINSEAINSFNKIIKFSEGKAGKLISFVLQRFTLANIRAIIRGKMKRIPEEEIKEALLPIYPLDAPKIDELLKKESAFDVMKLIITWRISLPFPLTRNILKMLKEEKLKEVEYEIEKSFFENVLKEIGYSWDDKIIEHVLKSWIDIRNIIGSLLLLKYNIRPSGKIEYLKGGYVSERILKKLSECENLSDGLNILSSTRYKKIFGDGVDISIFERRFEESLTNWAIQGFIKDPLSIYVPVAYIFSKYNELVNLRIIVYGIDQNISPFEIKKYIFIK